MRSFVFLAALLVLVSCTDMPYIWPLPKDYSYGEKTVTVDAQHFRFITSKQSNELIEAFHRYMDVIFYKKSALVEEGVRSARIEVEEGKVELQLDTDESYTL